MVKPSRLPAVLLTAIALALLNIGLAGLIVAAMGVQFAPIWVAGALLAGGVVAAVGAVLLWRSYLRALETH